MGNDKLDSSRIKGFTIELNMDSQGDVGSLVQGSLEVFNVAAVVPNSDAADDSSFSVADGVCIEERGVDIDETNPQFRRLEFLEFQCCELCEADEHCMYAMANDGDCFLASHLQPESISLINIRLRQEKVRVMRQESDAKRGDFCQICDCREEDRTIDCKGRDLAILPKTFSLPVGEPVWSPQVLDLYDNPRLVLLGPGSLESVSESIQELRLPANLQFVSHYALGDLLSLTKVTFESGTRDDDKSDSESTASTPFPVPKALDSVAANMHSIQNLIIDRTGFFSDVCCGLGEHVALTTPSGGLTFCDMKVDTPGADAEFEPFIEYFQAQSMETLQPR